MLSSRTHWDQTPNALARAVARRKARGEPVIDLTESNPTRCAFEYPAESILEAIAGPGALDYRPDPRGMLSAREAVARATRGVDVDPGRVILTAGTSEAYAWLFKLLCESGDEVLVPAPGYPLFDFIARLEGVRVRRYPLVYEGAWRLDQPALRCAVGKRTRAIVVVQPNNPTGSLLDAGEVRELIRLCREKGLALVSDEVFLGFPLDASVEAGSSLAGTTEVPTFCLGGLSKSAGLPQMKLSWIIASGPAPERDEALARLELIADTFLSVGTPVQRGLGALLEAGESVRAQIRERVRANRAFLAGVRRRDAAWDLLEAEAGWYAVLRVPRTLSEDEWAIRLLESDGVLVHPGWFFDFPQAGHLVLSLLPAAGVFREGASRLAARLAGPGG